MLQENKSFGIRYVWLFAGLFFCFGTLQAQKVEVPSTIHFADMQLELAPAARKKIQTDVDALLRSEKYFLLKLQKVDAHFPLIEQVLKEEKVPDDIKYLVIQESALVGDAVSTSNAIGYWQFKEPAAREVGITINHLVDERMNIINATRGAARYFKNNNTFFDNWLYALLAYNTGPGGALKLADKSNYGKRNMRLDGNTHWYVLKFLAHKVAFENAVGKNPHPEVQLFTYTDGNNKTLEEIAREFRLEAADLESYNRWLKARRVPDDKKYFVIIPDFGGRMQEELLAQNKPVKSEEKERVQEKQPEAEAAVFTEVGNTQQFPVVKPFKRRGAEVKINGIPGIIAREGDNIRTISQRSGISTSRVVTFNDLTSKSSKIVPGQPYYIRNKRNRGAAHYHVVEENETLWSISQRFGIKLKKLMRNNRMREEEKVKPGRVLWLRYIRPPHIPVEYRDAPQQQKQPAASPVKPEVRNDPPARIEQKAPAGNMQQTAVNQESYESWEQNAQTPSQPKPAEQTEQEQVSPQQTGFDSSTPVNFVDTHTTETEEASIADHHIVQKGDTYYSIARRYELTIPQIKQMNGLTADAPLKIGQRLSLTPASPPSTEVESSAEVQYVYHRVQTGETLYKVARAYQVTVKDLMEWNEKKDFNVAVGEQLKIAKK